VKERKGKRNKLVKYTKTITHALLYI